METCQFVNVLEMLRAFSEGMSGYKIGTRTTQKRPTSSVCGAPATREVQFNANINPFWLCAEHYDLIIGQDWWEPSTPQKRAD